MSVIRSLKISAILLSHLLMANPVQSGETDPLTPQELQQTLSLAGVATGSARSSRSTAGSALPLTPELLLVERRILDKNAAHQRLADAYHYDYATNETIHSIIDLDTQQLISAQRHQHMQLPLTENELQRSSGIIFADPEQAALIRSEYQRITGQYLSSPDQLQIKAFAFSADTLPEQLNPASQQCGLHRCAQVLLYTHDSIVFEISPIVNLSAGIVTQNIGY